jgi:hypothetical protein
MTEKKSRRSVTHRAVSPAERMTIIQLWTSGQGKVKDIADAMRRPPSTIYNVIINAGLWPGYDDYTQAGKINKSGVIRRPRQKKVGKPVEISAPAQTSKPVEPAPMAPIELIAGPRRGVWQRIKDFFA